MLLHACHPLRRFLGHYIFSSLTRRILFLNLAALGVLVIGILYLNQFREGLIEARVQSLLTQGEIIAGAIASSATVETNTITIDPEVAGTYLAYVLVSLGFIYFAYLFIFGGLNGDEKKRIGVIAVRSSYCRGRCSHRSCSVSSPRSCARPTTPKPAHWATNSGNRLTTSTRIRSRRPSRP